MAIARIIGLYPQPTDADTFEQRYRDEHIPLAREFAKATGASQTVLSKLADTPQGKQPFLRMAEICYPTADAMMAALTHPAATRLTQNAQELSTGGPLVVLLCVDSEELT